MRVVEVAIGVVVFVLAWTSVVLALVLPRGQWGPGRIATLVVRAVHASFVGLSRLTRDYERRDTILAPVGPVAVLVQLFVWLLLLGVGFTVMLEPYAHDWADAAGQVSAAMFTLGQARTGVATNDTVTMLAGASGFVVIALQI